MKGVLFALSAISMAVAADAALAESSPRAREWLDAATAQLTRELSTTLAQPGAAPVEVSFSVGSDRRLNSGRVVRGSGSREFDDAVVSAARKVRADAKPPVELVGRRVTFRLAPDGAVTQTAASAVTEAVR